MARMPRVLRALLFSYVALQSVCNAELQDELKAAMERVADQMRDKYDMGLAAAFYSPKLNFTVASGYTDAGLGMGNKTRLAQVDDLYVWGSTTKMITAPAVLQLVEQGKVNLTDPIALHIDPILIALNGTRLEDHFGSPIHGVQIQHLLHMTSGIQDYDGEAFSRAQFANRSKAFGPIEIIGKFVSPTLQSVPGQQQMYCSTNYILLGLVLATHYHQPDSSWAWQNYDQASVVPKALQKVFKNSKFVMSGPCSQYTPVHGFMEFYPSAQLPKQDVWDVSCLGGWTAGNYVGSVADVARFTYELYNKKKSSILSSASQALLTNFSAPHMGPFPMKFYGMGTFNLAWSVGTSDAYGHVGDTYGYQSQTTYIPEDDFVITVATNVETTKQAQPADFTCLAYHELKAVLTGRPKPHCAMVIPQRFIGKCVCMPEIVAIAVPAQGQVDTFKPFELSTILWSYGKMSLANQDLCSCAQPLFKAAAGTVPRLLEDFTLRCLVTIAWSFAAYRHKEEHLFQAIGDHLISQVHTANCGELANIAWAYGLLQIHHERLFQEVARRANVRLQDFKQQEIASIIWGFAASDILPAAFFSNAALAAQRLALTPQQTTNILWALTRRRCKQSSVATTVLALLPPATKQIERFNMPEIAICSMAAAKVVKHAESSKAGAPKVANAMEFCVKAMQQALSRLSELSNTMLVNLAAAFLMVGCPGSVVLLAAAGREALHRLQVLENPVLLHLIRVFSVDLGTLQPPALLEGACQGMFRALFAEAARRMDSFKPREMQSLSVLCAQPLGLENAGDMSAGDLRSCCFALATTGSPAHQPLSLLDELLEEDQDLFWDPDPVEAANQ
ncbi:Putative sodium-coupled neutral amino acid transporter 10 [Durusdinium trenchii]|uniref:Sodium-coupled neutral amino acid transporter 10 n=1 Tax=Durusdinium trenchii TaxID=1381693 RepID=A0ABP0LCU3_9DINO